MRLRARFEVDMLRFNIASLAVAAALLAGCPEDEGGNDATDGGTNLDGESCEPNTVFGCPSEKGPVAQVCNDNGTSYSIVDCNDRRPDGETADYVCFTGANGPDCVRSGDFCLEGEIKECTPEGSREALICNASQTAFQQQPCKNENGDLSMCKDKQCTFCFPGERKCLTETQVGECNAEGTAFEVAENCNPLSEDAVCTGTQCENLCEKNFKNNSYIGCEYFAVDLDNAFVQGGNEGFFDAAGAQYAVVVANPPDSPLPAIVEIFQMEGGVEETVLYDSFGEPFDTAPLQPGELRTYKLPRRDVNGTTLAPLAYRVFSTVPIVAYQFNPLTDEGVFSNDASLLLPSTLLGSEYIAMTREQSFAELRGFISVVAVMPGETEVSVTVSTSTQPGRAYQGSPDEYDIEHLEPGTTENFRLKQYDVLNLETDGQHTTDLTGSYIVSNRPVAVFGGSEAANAPNTARCVDIDPVTLEGVCLWDMETPCRSVTECVNAGFNTCCADHLEQQMFPLKTWGSHFVASKSWDRNKEKDIFRIMASENNTRVTLVPPIPGILIPVLNRGQHFEFESDLNFEIVSDEDKPLMVGHFLAAQDAPDPTPGPGDAGTGDPAFMLAVPVEQYRRDYVILVPGEYEQNFFNVTLPTGSTLTVDGAEILPTDFTLVGSGEYSVYRQPLDPGAHTILCSEPAGLIVYGWDQYVSYAYTGGLDLADRTATPTP